MALDRRLLALAAGMFAIGTDSFVIAGILPHIARTLDVSIAAAGQIITAYALSYAISTPIAAALTSRWPTNRVLVAGLTIFGTGSICTALSSNIVSMTAARMMCGIGAAMFAPAASAAATALVPAHQRGTALSILMAGLAIATAIGSPFGTLIGAYGDWRVGILLAGCIGILSSVFAGRTFTEVLPSARGSLRERLSPLRNRRVMLTLLATFLVLSGLYVVYSYISVVFDRSTGNNGWALPLLLSVWGVSAVIGSLLAGYLTDRFGARLVINAALTVVAVDFLLLPWTSAHLASAIFSLAIWGLCGWGFVIPQQIRLVEYAPERAQISLSLYAATVYGGVSAAGVLGGVALQVIDPYQLSLVGTLLILAGFVAAELAGSTSREAPQGQPELPR